MKSNESFGHIRTPEGGVGERIAFHNMFSLRALYEDSPQKVLRCVGDVEKTFGIVGDVQSFVRHFITEGTVPEQKLGGKSQEMMAKEINVFLQEILKRISEGESRPARVYGKEYFPYPRGRRVEPVRQEDVDRRRQGAAHADPYYFGAYGDDDDVED